MSRRRSPTCVLSPGRSAIRRSSGCGRGANGSRAARDWRLRRLPRDGSGAGARHDRGARGPSARARGCGRRRPRAPHPRPRGRGGAPRPAQPRSAAARRGAEGRDGDAVRRPRLRPGGPRGRRRAPWDPVTAYLAPPGDPDSNRRAPAVARAGRRSRRGGTDLRRRLGTLGRGGRSLARCRGHALERRADRERDRGALGAGRRSGHRGTKGARDRNADAPASGVFRPLDADEVRVGYGTDPPREIRSRVGPRPRRAGGASRHLQSIDPLVAAIGHARPPDDRVAGSISNPRRVRGLGTCGSRRSRSRTCARSSRASPRDSRAWLPAGWCWTSGATAADRSPLPSVCCNSSAPRGIAPQRIQFRATDLTGPARARGTQLPPVDPVDRRGGRPAAAVLGGAASVAGPRARVQRHRARL